MRATAHRQAGFSLVEIIVVLVIVGLMFGLVGGSIYRNMDGVKIRRAGKDVVTALRRTRAQAILKRDEQMLEVNIDQRSYTPPGGKATVLPDGVDVTLRTAAMDILDESRGRIRFYPDGSSTGGTITLMAGERVWRIQVAWLTGEITLEDSVEAT